VSSDGIMVDSTSPVSGTVYDGVGKYYVYNIHYHGYKQHLPTPSYTVPDTGLVPSTIIPSDDTVVCSLDNVYYTQIHT
jgi:hypothetical protein